MSPKMTHSANFIQIHIMYMSINMSHLRFDISRSVFSVYALKDRIPEHSAVPVNDLLCTTFPLGLRNVSDL